MSYSVSIADEARNRLLEYRRWWNENREASRLSFKDALMDAVARIGQFPNSFPKYRDRDVRFCRIEKTPYLLLFSVDIETQKVVVVSAWSASLGEAR